jgi:hypothetical protein
MSRPAIGAVELAHDLVALLDHRDLVFAHRHDAGLEGGDVGGLAGRVDQEAGRDVALEAAQHDFRLDGRVALEARDGHQVQVIEGQLGQFRNLRLDQDGRLGRIDPYGKVIERHFDDVPVYLTGVIHVVGERLGVREHDELAILVLVGDAVAQAAHEVAEVQRAGRTVAGQDDGRGCGCGSGAVGVCRLIGVPFLSLPRSCRANKNATLNRGGVH